MSNVQCAMCNETVRGIPGAEYIWLERRTRSGETYFITSKPGAAAVMFYIYQLTDGKAVKLGKGASPVELEKKYVK